MLGLVGVIAAESSTGISWADAGKVMAEQPSYLGFDINIPLTTIVWIEVLAMGFVEVKRSAGASPEPHPNPAHCWFFRPATWQRARFPSDSARSASRREPPACAHLAHLSSPPRRPSPPSRSTELDSDKRCYPGGYFDPLGFASSASPEALFKLQTAELKHGRLAMIGMLGISIQALKNGLSPLEAINALGN